MRAAEVGEDGAHDRGVLHGGDDAQPAATAGGLGSREGPLVGTALFFLAREFMILLGTLAVGVMLAYPQGLRGIVADRRDLRFFPVQRRVRLERN